MLPLMDIIFGIFYFKFNGLARRGTIFARREHILEKYFHFISLIGQFVYPEAPEVRAKH